jgi:signal transduction histidine kinase/ligand-binding sensor domain-containing protein
VLKVVAIAALVWPTPAAFALNPDRLLNQYIQDRWTEEKGFPGGAVHAFAQSPDGYLWIASERGLVRFDGLRFQLFNHTNTPLLSESPVLDLALDVEGAVWIRSESTDVLRYLRGGFEAVTEAAGSTAMAQGPGQEVVLVRWAQALRYRNHSLFSVPHPAGQKLVISTAVTPDGALWGGTRDSGLFCVNQDRTAEVGGLPDRKINHLLPAEGNTLWVGTDRGLAKWNGAAITQEGLPAALKAVPVAALARDRDSNIWVGTPGGLMRLTAAGAFAADPRAEAVNAVFEDREGDLWVGGPQGIERYRDTTFLTFPSPGEGGGPVYVDAAGRAWEAPSSGGLFWLEHARWRPVTVDGLDHDVIYSTDGGPDGIWVGRQRGGLTRLRLDDGATAKTYTAADGLAKGSIYAVRRAHDGTVWAGSLGGGISRIRDGRITTYTTADGLVSNTISAIEEAADGTIWVATPDGLSTYFQDRWHTLPARDALPPTRINCLARDSAGALWIGTNMGLAFVRGGQARVPRDQPPALVDQILGIADDGHDGLWISTPRFVARLSRSHLLDVTPGPLPMRIFGLPDGIPVPEGVRRDRSVVRDAANRIWFSLRRSVSMVDPARLGAVSAPPPVHVETVSADGTALDLRTHTKIPAGRQRLRFEFLAISLSVPELVRYQYRLEPFDTGWSEPEAAREAVYTNLGPGSYRFRVIAANSEGIWSAAESSVSFEIVPAVWQTLWFRTLAVAAIGLMSLGVYRLHLRQVKRLLNVRFEERLAERTRIAKELHDTLLQGLLAASMQFNLAVDAIPEDSPLRSRFDRALAILRQVMDEGRNAIRGLRSPGTDTGELETAFRKIREEFAAAKSIDFRIVVDGRPRPLNPLVRDEVYRIGREALTNAFRHSGSPKVEMHIRYNGNLRVAVRDKGRGFDERSGIAGRSGLTGMRDRAEEIGARLRVSSRVHAGTEVVLTVPGSVAFSSNVFAGTDNPKGL